MSRETEKIFRMLHEYLEKNGADDMNEEEFNRLSQQFIQEYQDGGYRTGAFVPSTAEDYLELAEEASSKKKRIEYIKKALELEPDNLDAALALISCTVKNPQDMLDSMANLAQKAEEQMEKGGFFRDCTGDFWGVLETRPYMRVCFEYVVALATCGKIRKAIGIAERLMELCPGDNLGVRYILLALYASIEDEASAKALVARSEYEESGMLMTMAALYYKLDQPLKAQDYLQRLQKCNKDTKKFFRSCTKGDYSKLDYDRSFGYRPDTAEELLEQFDSCLFLFSTIPGFFLWGNTVLKEIGKKASKK